MALSVAEQHRRIRKDYPDFKLVCDLGFMGVWEGHLTPIFQKYKIRITYIAYPYFDNFTVSNPRETIIVLDPPIGSDPRGTGDRAQHTYWWNRDPDFPRLCVHDPLADDWDADKPIADTLIPFTIDWLLWHEDWVATGLWRGRGRHPEMPKCSGVGDPDSGSTNEPPPFPMRRFLELGAMSGTYATYRTMGSQFCAYFWAELAFPLPAYFVTNPQLQVPNVQHIHSN